MPTTSGRGSRPPAAFRARGHGSWPREHVEWSKVGLPALITHSTPARSPKFDLDCGGELRRVVYSATEGGPQAGGTGVGGAAVGHAAVGQWDWVGVDFLRDRLGTLAVTTPASFKLSVHPAHDPADELDGMGRRA
jgi:hypothetical protein